MSQEKQKLEELMSRIKVLLAEADVAATVVLTMPVDGAPPLEFISLQGHHVNTSYSCAKTFIHHCCTEHGQVEGIAFQAQSTTENHVAVMDKVQKTIGIFLSLARGLHKAEKMVEVVLLQVNGHLNRQASGQANNNNGGMSAANMN